MEYKNRAGLLVLIGIPLLLAGVGLAFLGPLEMYCFYFFVEGGRFAYPGFGFGSFMFGFVAAQIVSYYLLAAVLIPLGYGHLRLRRWVRPLVLAVLWTWLVIGIPMALAFLFVLLTNKEPTVLVVAASGILLAASYLVLPWLLIRFYNGHNVRLTLEARDPTPSWIERLPVPVLVVAALMLFYIVVLHVLILFRGITPVFGTWLFDVPGIVVLDASIWFLSLCTWGMLRLRRWAWWGSLIFFGAFSISAIWTLAVSRYLDILSGLRFAPLEVDVLDGMPLQGYHLAALAGAPLLLTVVAVLRARRCFYSGDRAAGNGDHAVAASSL